MLVKDFKRDFYDAIQHQVRNNIEMRKRLHSYCLINYASFTFVCKHKISSRKKCRLLHTVEISERRGRIKTFDSDVTFHYVVKMIFFSIISQRVLVLVAFDVDALCASKILQVIFFNKYLCLRNYAFGHRKQNHYLNNVLSSIYFL